MTILWKTAIFSLMVVGIIGLPWGLTAEEGRIIQISAIDEGGSQTGISATPTKLSIEKDIIVIWLNGIKGEEVNILFEDGEAVRSATANPMGFDLDKKGAYAAKYLPFISTTSLRFVKKGVYPYKVTSQHEKWVTQGTIIVP